MKRNSPVLLLFVLFVSCTESFHSEQEMLDYASDASNGYRYTKAVNGVDFTLQYRPTDLLVKQELGDVTDEKEIKRAREKYKSQLYFNLSMSLNGQELLSNVVGDKDKFGQMVSELAFNMDKKIHLFTAEKDTVPIIDFVYPRMYGTSKSTTMLIIYPRDEKFLKEQYLNFTIEDLGFYTGEVRFKIDTRALQNEPHLIFD